MKPGAAQRLHTLWCHLAATAAPVAATTDAEPTYSPHDAEFVRHTAVPRFEPGSADATDFFEREGFCVFKSVLTPGQASHTLRLLWKFLEAQGTGVRRGLPSTWADDDWSPSGGNPGLHSGYGLAQSEAAWFVRGQKRVQRVWAGVFGVPTGELICSFDGIAALRPSGLNRDWATNAGNFHIDGARQNGGFDPGARAYCQGLVNLVPTAPNRAGNVVVPRSHRRYQKLARQYSKDGLKPDCQLIVDKYPQELRGAIRAQMQAGDALIWDDRTIHGSGPGIGPGPTEPELERAAVLVSMYPRARARPAVLASRVRAIEFGWSGGGGGWCGHNQLYETNGNQGGGGRSGPWPEENVARWKRGLNPRFAIRGPPTLTPEQRAVV